MTPERRRSERASPGRARSRGKAETRDETLAANAAGGVLGEYRRKREFDKTPEPGPEVASSPGGNLYVIQKHRARALHYDLRLELDGVMVSWAIPKGPSLDPADKHLAVHVEDHPLDYNEFEGVIPKGQYGGGTVMIWDRGHWYPEEDAASDPGKAVRNGALKFRLEGEKLRGRWMLVRMKPRPGQEDDKENWLLFKERDDEARAGDEARITEREPDSVVSGRSIEQIADDADRVWNSDGDRRGEQPQEVVRQLKQERAAAAKPAAARGAREGGPTATAIEVPDPSTIEGARKAPLPARVEPELATLVAEAPAGDGWLHEIKLDGYRVLCRLDHGTPRLFTRRGADWTSHFPTLVGPVAEVPADTALLDGEVVYVKDDGHTSFLKLASALQGGTDPEGRVVYYVFDLLHLNGYDLTRAPLWARKQALERLLAGFPAGARVRYVEHVKGRGDEFFRQACGFALEGSIAKRASAPYRPGRGRDWLKVKCLQRQEFVIGGFTERADAKGGIGALLMGYHDEPNGPLHYAGRVGTGWDETTMRELRRRLDELVQDDAAFVDPPKGRDAQGVLWVRPELVAEIEYLSWTDKGLFRHPSFEGLRLDKPAGDVMPERAVAQTAAKQPFAPPPDALTPPAPTRPADAPTPPDQSEPQPAKAGRSNASSGKGDGVKEAGKRQRPTRSSSKADGAAAADVAKPKAAGGGSKRQSEGRVVVGGVSGGGSKRKSDERVVVGGVSISHPDRVMYPDIGLTKLEVARYYEDMAEWFLPYVVRRPLTLVRCPEGYTNECFFQKKATDTFPETIIRVPVKENGGHGIYVAVDSLAGILSLVQMSALEFHVWGSHLETLEQPDQMVFDLDPDEGLPFDRVVDAARILRSLLGGLGLQSFVKTSGGKGLHVVVPLEPARGWDEVKEFSHALTDAMVAADPASFVATMSLKKRVGKVYIDFLRNGRGATFIIPYGTRRRPGAPVSAPLRWDELSAKLRGDLYTVGNLRRRMASLKADPWEGYGDVRQEITDDALRAVGLKPTRRKKAA